MTKPTQQQIEAAIRITQEFTWQNDDKWSGIIANLLAQREATAKADGVKQGLEQGLKRAAMAARLAMVKNPNADELTCTICATEVRKLMEK